MGETVEGDVEEGGVRRTALVAALDVHRGGVGGSFSEGALLGGRKRGENVGGDELLLL